MLRALKASHENLAVKAHSQDLIRFLRLISLAVEPAILPARPLGDNLGCKFVCGHLCPERPWRWRDSWVCPASCWGFSWSSLVSTLRWSLPWSSLVSTLHSLFGQLASQADRHFQSDSPHHSQSLRVSTKGFFASDPAPLSATRWRMPPLRCELELLWPSTTSRTACASAILLRTPPLGDMMNMQVRTEQTRVAKCKVRSLRKTPRMNEMRKSPCV